MNMVFIHGSTAYVSVPHSHVRLQTIPRGILRIGSNIPSQSCFIGRKLRNLRSRDPQRLHNIHCPRMLVDPWSVSPATLDTITSQLFAVSIIPYLTFLYYLNRQSVNCPPLANFGFRFLLVFVFVTIPAGIYAKMHYHEILANVDILHGAAESLLTVTNLLVVLGFRRALQPFTASDSAATSSGVSNTKKLYGQVGVVALAVLGLMGVTVHAEPWNALSFPTWIIHISSLVEWLVAMGLVWRYADTASNSRWKGLTWGMLPLHTSGICACTYHLFYNASNLNGLVTLQALLTLVGNGTMAYAAYRLANGEAPTEGGKQQVSYAAGGDNRLIGFEDLAEGGDSEVVLLGKVLLVSVLGSAGVKWGELLFDQPFEANIALALGIIGVATVMNVMKWTVRSRSTR